MGCVNSMPIKHIKFVLSCWLLHFAFCFSPTLWETAITDALFYCFDSLVTVDVERSSCDLMIVKANFQAEGVWEHGVEENIWI